MKSFLPIFILFFELNAFAQKLTISGQAVEKIYRTQDTTENFYLALKPEKSAKGLLVILPGFGGLIERVLDETDLPAKARANGYVVIIPYLRLDTFYTDSISQERLVALIPEVIKKFNVPKDKFIIGGHSAGGNGALLYSENAYRSKSGKIIKPNLIFGVDPPLDMKRLWNLFVRLKDMNFRKGSSDEAVYFLERFKKELGGTPIEKPLEYEKISSFYRDAKEGGKIIYLKSVPVRLYCDPDIQWYIENRRLSYEDINASDLSACIVQLKLLGNENAQLVTNIGKGYFPGGVRHPHGFTQLDADEFLTWADKFLNAK